MKKWKLYCFLIEKRLQVYNNNNGDNDDDYFNTNVEDNGYDDSDTAGCSRPAPKGLHSAPVNVTKGSNGQTCSRSPPMMMMMMN